MIDWGDKAKRILKSELIKRAVSNVELALLLNAVGVEETKASIDSKISRGTFSASFFLQCLSVIGCSKIEIEEFPKEEFKYENNLTMAAEPSVEYKIEKNGK
jgi:Domain of unknown function (DUF6471)